MYDSELVKDILKNILWAIDQIRKRFQGIKSSDDFLKDDTGLEKLESICMQLINIGEATKQIDKITECKLLQNYPEVDWKKAKGMRNIIIHHYFDIDAETVYTVCNTHLPQMVKFIKKILSDLDDSCKQTEKK